MLLRQFLQARAHTVELVNFIQDRLKRHAYAWPLAENLRWENFRWTGLGQRPERGEGGNRPGVTVTRQKIMGLIQIDL